jgi:hypothetical protein
VLAMFAGFDFDWPPSIRAMLNLFSLLNFNFELLAPECSVSINYEAKWYVAPTFFLCCARRLRIVAHPDSLPLVGQ